MPTSPTLFFVEPGRVEWREVDAPTLDATTDVLVRPIAVATCDLDAAIIAGVTPYAPPFALGHEFVGEVVAVGADVRSVQPGARVVVPFQVSCGVCRFCRRGLTANCDQVPRTSMFGIGAAGGNWGGAFTDVLRIPFADHMLLPLPAALPARIAARVGDNVADAYRAVAPGLAAQPGARVAILCGGLKGSIPLYAVQLARALGASAVDFYDQNTARAEVAAGLGAVPHHIPEWPKRLGAYPITVDATSQPDGLACALRSTEPGGICTSTSMYFDPLVGIPMTEMYMKGVTLNVGRVQSRAILPAVLEALATHAIDLDQLPTDVCPWDDAARALPEFGLKLVVVRDGA